MNPILSQLPWNKLPFSTAVIERHPSNYFTRKGGRMRAPTCRCSPLHEKSVDAKQKCYEEGPEFNFDFGTFFLCLLTNEYISINKTWLPHGACLQTIFKFDIASKPSRLARWVVVSLFHFHSEPRQCITCLFCTRGLAEAESRALRFFLVPKPLQTAQHCVYNTMTTPSESYRFFSFVYSTLTLRSSSIHRC